MLMIVFGGHDVCTLWCRVYVKVGVKISLASCSLTKIVTFTPYYVLINQAKVDHIFHLLAWLSTGSVMFSASDFWTACVFII